MFNNDKVEIIYFKNNDTDSTNKIIKDLKSLNNNFEFIKIHNSIDLIELININKHNLAIIDISFKDPHDVKIVKNFNRINLPIPIIFIADNFNEYEYEYEYRSVKLDSKYLIVDKNNYASILSAINFVINQNKYNHKNANKIKIYEQAINLSTSSILIVKLNGEFLFFNREYCNLTKFNDSEILNFKLFDFFDEKDSEYIANQLSKKMNNFNDINKINNVNLIAKDGEKIYVDISFLKIPSGLFYKNNDLVFIINLNNINEIKNTKKQLEIACKSDLTSGILNKDEFFKQLNKEIKEYNIGAKTFFCAFYLGIDNFKIINSVYGKEFGDKIISMIPDIIKKEVSNFDHVFKMDGDKFSCIINSLYNMQQVTYIAESLINHFSKKYIYVDNIKCRITVSVGFYICEKEKTEQIKIPNADKISMYLNEVLDTAKMSGKNTYKFYSPQVSELEYSSKDILGDLHGALKNKEFILYYQPQFNSKTNTLIGCEALLRWDHKNYKKLSPQIYIPLAEKSGLMTNIGNWVLEEAVSKVTEWNGLYSNKLLNSGFKMSINVSPIQLFQNENFIATVSDLLDKYELNKNLINLEITETTILSNIEEAKRIFKLLKKIGVSISIDDFGTGYSSLSHLSILPIDSIKIDKSFVDGLRVEKGFDNGIVSGIIAIARAMGVGIIAEGVEYKDQIDFLSDQKCYNIQGYYFAKPMPEKEFINMLNKEFGN